MGIFASHDVSPRNQPRSKFTPKSLALPRRVIYIDYANIDWNSPGDTVIAAADAGFNVINLGFYLISGAADFCASWESLDGGTQTETLDSAHQRGAVVLVSAGGATDSPYTLTGDAYANKVCTWAVKNNLDGVDYDLENLGPGFTGTGTDDLYTWMLQLNTTSRNILGPGRLLTHTPQLPYASAPGYDNTWPGQYGGYYKVYQDFPDIDWFNFQVYNQGNDNYYDYQTTFLQSAPGFPYSAFSQINNDGKGIPWNKMVYGTYLPNYGGSGVNDPAKIQTYFKQACIDFSYNAGVMIWLWVLGGQYTPYFPPGCGKTATKRGERLFLN